MELGGSPAGRPESSARREVNRTAKKAKKGNGKAKAAKPAQQRPDSTKPKPVRRAADLDALRKPVLAAKAKLEVAETEAKALVQKAEALMAQAKQGYREALVSSSVI
jgi:hypothetical protein